MCSYQPPRRRGWFPCKGPVMQGRTNAATLCAAPPPPGRCGESRRRCGRSMGGDNVECGMQRKKQRRAGLSRTACAPCKMAGCAGDQCPLGQESTRRKRKGGDADAMRRRHPDSRCSRTCNYSTVYRPAVVAMLGLGLDPDCFHSPSLPPRALRRGIQP